MLNPKIDYIKRGVIVRRGGCNVCGTLVSLFLSKKEMDEMKDKAKLGNHDEKGRVQEETHRAQDEED